MHPKEQKFFGSFFQKRTACLAYNLARRRHGALDGLLDRRAIVQPAGLNGFPGPRRPRASAEAGPGHAEIRSAQHHPSAPRHGRPSLPRMRTPDTARGPLDISGGLRRLGPGGRDGDPIRRQRSADASDMCPPVPAAMSTPQQRASRAGGFSVGRDHAHAPAGRGGRSGGVGENPAERPQDRLQLLPGLRPAFHQSRRTAYA